MIFKIKYTMYDQIICIEYVHSSRIMKTILKRVIEHKYDDKNVRYVDVFIIDHIPEIQENIEEFFVSRLEFSDLDIKNLC